MDALKKSLFYFLLYSLTLGVLYPALTTIVGRSLFSSASQGSLIFRNNITIGSHLVGQEFKSERYFWGRPSATTNNAYNTLSSSGSNQALSNPAFQSTLNQRISSLGLQQSIPVDLVTASASGLDPDISIASANIQIDRIAHARAIDRRLIEEIISKQVKPKLLGVLGEPHLNVLSLNCELDKL